MKKLLFVTVVALTFWSVGAQAELYRWTDADGKVHYSDRKPDDADQSERIDQTLKPVNIDESREQIQALGRVFPDEDPAAERAENSDRQRREEHRQAQCRKLRERLAKVKGPVNFIDEDGKVMDVSEKERREHEKELEALIAKHCE